MNAARVLVVDDEEVTRVNVRRILNREGVHADVVEDGEQALDYLARTRCDLVITDLRMPGVDGLTLLRRIRQWRPALPAIVMTAAPALEAVEAGATDLLSKPFTRRQLCDAVQLALRTPVPCATRSPGTPVLQTSWAAAGTRLVIRGHSWARLEGRGRLVVGIEPKFASLLTDLEWVRLPREGETIDQWEACAKLVGQKSGVRAVRAPVSVRVDRINSELLPSPWRVAQSPLGSGWLFEGTPLRLRAEMKPLLLVNSDGRVLAEEEEEDLC